MLPQDSPLTGNKIDKSRLVEHAAYVEVDEESFGLVKTDIQISGWENNKRFQDALKEILLLAFEDNTKVTDIMIKAKPME